MIIIKTIHELFLDFNDSIRAHVFAQHSDAFSLNNERNQVILCSFILEIGDHDFRNYETIKIFHIVIIDLFQIAILT